MAVWRGIFLVPLMLAASASAQTPPALAPAASPPPACTSTAHRAFDFWVGEWSVTQTGKPKPVADSKIEKLYAGCAIRENWMPFNNAGGGSLNSYDSSDGQWHQLWIDNSGTRVEFVGGPVGNTMRLTGYWGNLVAPGKHAWVRMTYTPSADGSVRQFGEQSVDFGQTWGPSFDFTYHPKASAK